MGFFELVMSGACHMCGKWHLRTKNDISNQRAMPSKKKTETDFLSVFCLHMAAASGMRSFMFIRPFAIQLKFIHWLRGNLIALEYRRLPAAPIAFIDIHLDFLLPNRFSDGMCSDYLCMLHVLNSNQRTINAMLWIFCNFYFVLQYTQTLPHSWCGRLAERKKCYYFIDLLKQMLWFSLHSQQLMMMMSLLFVCCRWFGSSSLRSCLIQLSHFF